MQQCLRFRKPWAKLALMQTSPQAQPRIRIGWDHVDELMKAHDIPTDAELARRAGIPQSTILRARRGSASLTVINAVLRVFPDVDRDRLLLVPKDAP